MPSKLALEIATAFEKAEWKHSPATDFDTLGTSMFLHGRMLGGSIRVYNGTIIRFLAFNSIEVPEGRESAVAELLSKINPQLLLGTVEVDEMLGVVCRASLDVAGLLQDSGAVSDPKAFHQVIIDLATAATAVLDQYAPVVEAVCEGASASDALAGAQPVG